MDKYVRKKIRLIREARENEDELGKVINQIYEDGFADAVNEMEEEK